MIAPLPSDEVERLNVLRGLKILDTLPESDYDDLTRLAATICGTPIALVSLIDCNRQWFKSRVGLDAPQTPRDLAFCAHAILRPELFVVPDAAEDERFHNNPLVTSDPHIRFYAGMPLTTPAGFALGTLCVIDRTPRALSTEQQDGLRVLARQVVAHLMLRQKVADLERVEAERRASEERLRTLGDNLPDGAVYQYVLSADGQGHFPYVSRGIERLIGVTAAEVMADPTALTDRNHPDDAAVMLAAIADSQTNLTIFDQQFRITRQDGAVRWCHARSAPRRLPCCGTAWDGVLTDITVRKQAEEELGQYQEQLIAYQAELEGANAKLKAVATTDGLTKVKNRAAFNDKLSEEFDRSLRYTHPLSVILLDVDHFKQFNDTFGHPAGDDVLRKVAGLLQHTVRTTDTVARYGGEEFVILLPDTDYAGAMVLAERCRRAVAGTSWDKRPVTISVGVSTLTGTTTDAATLVKEADDALYRSKKAGRNRVTHGSQAVPQVATVRT